MYAIAARRHLHELRTQEPDVRVEIGWCPAHKGVGGNEIVDGWPNRPPTPRMSATPSGLKHLDSYGRKRSMPFSRSLAHHKREIVEAKWVEAKQWLHAHSNLKKY